MAAAEAVQPERGCAMTDAEISELDAVIASLRSTIDEAEATSAS